MLRNMIIDEARQLAVDVTDQVILKAVYLVTVNGISRVRFCEMLGLDIEEDFERIITLGKEIARQAIVGT